MGLDKEAIKRMFPNLAQDLQTEENKVTVNSVRTDTFRGEKAVSKDLTHYNPDAIDFIRRCDTERQAEEIVAYMEKRGEIDKSYAARLRKQLSEKGVRSFGPKKERDFYLRQGKF